MHIKMTENSLKFIHTKITLYQFYYFLQHFQNPIFGSKNHKICFGSHFQMTILLKLKNEIEILISVGSWGPPMDHDLQWTI